MILKWAGFAAFAVTVAGLAWGISGLVDGSCPGGVNRCAAPPGTGKYFAATMISAFAVFAGFFPVIRTEDWRPTLGLLLGAVVGVGTALWQGQSLGYWILAGTLLVVASAIVLGVRAMFRNFHAETRTV
ncbi:hypothetical protein ACQEVY_28065 [Streptomyces sp. CA-288835]|uniref:hypothetical protein n=1 Tax=Streptomyces sp. CA-288835 TaxID=3240069 RepID=UPI003D8B9C3A